MADPKPTTARNPMLLAAERHPLVGYQLRAYRSDDRAPGPQGVITAVFYCSAEIGALVLAELANGGTVLLPLSYLLSASDHWTWILEQPP